LLLFIVWFDKPINDTVTPALAFALIVHLISIKSKKYFQFQYDNILGQRHSIVCLDRWNLAETKANLILLYLYTERIKTK